MRTGVQLNGAAESLAGFLYRNAGVVLVSGLTTLTCLVVYTRYGYEALFGLMALVPLFTILTIISLKYIQVPFIIWLIVLMGFRPMLFIPTPGLPDLTLDRVTMLWVVAAFAARTVAERRRLRPPFMPDLLILAHGTYLLLSCLFRNPEGFNLWTKSYLMAYTAYFLGKNLLADIRWLRRVMWVLLLMNIYHGFTAIAEHFHWDSLVWPKFILNKEIGFVTKERSRGVFLQPGVLGVALAMVVPIQFGLLLTSRGFLRKAIVVVSLLLAFPGLYFTYTRGTWVAAAGGLIALAVIGYRRYASTILSFALVATIVLSVGVVGLMQQDRFLKKRLESEHTLTGRINTMATAFRIFRDNPLFGCGFFRYNTVKWEYRETVKVPIFGVIRRSHDIESSLHDIYVGPLAEEGLFGMSLQVWFLVLTFRAFWRQYRRRASQDPVAMDYLPVIGGVMAAYFLGGISFDYRYFTTITSLFFFFCGIVHGLAHLPTSEVESSRVLSPLTSRRGRLTVHVLPRSS